MKQESESQRGEFSKTVRIHSQVKGNSWPLITGASSGFCEEFARQYAARGHSLVLVARREDRVERLAESLRLKYQVEVVVVGVDLSDLESVRLLHRRLRERGIAIDVLINNAGYGRQGCFQDASLQDALGTYPSFYPGRAAGLPWLPDCKK
jgi:short-subunit dehydrogenase